jgi:flagellar hook-basal body complex protein FliE
MSTIGAVGTPAFEPISWPTMPRPAAVEGGAETFGAALGRAVSGVTDMQAQAQEAAVALASGQPVDMAQTLVTIEKANISLQFALQVRNKLLEAYQDVMRIPV